MSFFTAASKVGRYSYQRKYEYAVKLSQEQGGNLLNIPRQPPTIKDEIVILAQRISDIFLSSSNYPQKYLEIMSYLVRVMPTYFHL